MIQEANGILI